jgi:hypothetical protein
MPMLISRSALETGSNPTPATPSSFSRIHPMLLIKRRRRKGWLLMAISLRPWQKRRTGQSARPLAPVSHCHVPVLRGRDQAVSQLVLNLNINRPGPEALNKIISKRAHLPRPLFSVTGRYLDGGAVNWQYPKYSGPSGSLTVIGAA